MNDTYFEAERWRSVEEIAAYLGVSKESIYRWAERRKIPSHKVGKQWKFKTKEVDAWVTSGNSSPESITNLQEH